MGKKVWLWIIAALAIVVALAVTAIMWFGGAKNPQSTEPDTTAAQEQPAATESGSEETAEPTQGQTEETQAQTEAPQATAGAQPEVPEDTTNGDVPEETTEFDPSSIPDPSIPNMLPLG